MDLSPILNPLNDAQREAVTAPLGPVLVMMPPLSITDDEIDRLVEDC